MTKVNVGVVLLNMGGPSSLDETETYLYQLFSDPAILRLPWPVRPLLARFIAHRRAPSSRERYRRLGGASPLLAGTRAQARALEERLSIPVRGVMRYGRPSSSEVLDELSGIGVRRLVVIPLYPQYSCVTTGSSLADIKRVAGAMGMEMAAVDAYPDHPGFIAALAEAATEAMEDVAGTDSEAAFEGLHLLFVAHSIPLSRLKNGDPYPEHVEATAKAIIARMGWSMAWSLAYQSRVGPVRWLGPSIDDEIERLGAKGVKALIVQPVSFACENLETLDDLDKDAAALAEKVGITVFRRGDTPNIRSSFIGALEDLATSTAAEAGWSIAGESTTHDYGSASGEREVNER